MMLLIGAARCTPADVGMAEYAYSKFLSRYPKNEKAFLSMLSAYINASQNEAAIRFCLENDEFVLGPVIIQKMADAISISVESIDNTYYFLENFRSSGNSITIELFNTVILACSKINDLDRAYGTYLEIEKFGITPNQQTFECLLQSDDITDGYTQAVLKEMERHNIEMNSKIESLINREQQI